MTLIDGLWREDAKGDNMNAVRFKAVIDAVQKQPAKQFNMGIWSGPSECGTAACAIGSFCIQNPKASLRLKEGDWCSDLVPIFNDLEGMGAVEAYLEIPYENADWLFSPGKGYRTKQQVLARLKFYYKNQLRLQSKL